MFHQLPLILSTSLQSLHLELFGNTSGADWRFWTRPFCLGHRLLLLSLQDRMRATQRNAFSPSNLHFILSHSHHRSPVLHLATTYQTERGRRILERIKEATLSPTWGGANIQTFMMRGRKRKGEERQRAKERREIKGKALVPERAGLLRARV